MMVSKHEGFEGFEELEPEAQEGRDHEIYEGVVP